MLPRASGRLCGLSARELEVARRYAQGATYKEIAEAVSRSPSTVRTHIYRVFRKLQIRNKAELVRLVIAESEGASCVDSGSASETRPAGVVDIEPLSITESVPVSPPPSEPNGSSHAAGTSMSERFHLTMAAYRVASPNLSSLGMESLHNVLKRFHQAVGMAVNRFDGAVAHLDGGVATASFGPPNGHEDDSERAIRSGLFLMECLQSIDAGSPTDRAPPIVAAVGIASGDVVVDSTRAGTPVVFGTASSHAQQMSLMAPEHSVLVTEAVHDRTRSRFAFEPHAPSDKTLRSLACSFWRATHTCATSRFNWNLPLRSRLVGRVAEVGMLKDRWCAAGCGDGQAMLLVGDPGIGKSRLVHEFSNSIEPVNPGPIQFQCSPFHRHTPLFPFVDRWSQDLALGESDPATGRRRVEAFLGSVDGVPPKQAAAVLSDALLNESAPVAPLQMANRHRLRRELVELATRLILPQSSQPKLLVIEDVHWIDSISLELVEKLIQAVANRNYMVVLTTRPAGLPGLHHNPRVAVMQVNALTHQESLSLVKEIGGTMLPDPAAKRMATRRRHAALPGSARDGISSSTGAGLGCGLVGR